VTSPRVRRPSLFLSKGGARLLCGQEGVRRLAEA